MNKKSIVILGAGFGGLRAALKLGHSLRRLKLEDRYHILLIDKNDHHTYTPLLYEVATTSKETADATDLHSIAAFKVAPIVKNLPVTFIKSEVDSLDIMAGAVNLPDGQKIMYDYMIFALGSEPNFFNIPGLEAHALPLKSFQDAIAIRSKIWDMAMEGAKQINVIVGGAGSTGVELAGELKAWCGELEGAFPACKLHIALIEGSPAILPGFEAKVQNTVLKRLKKLGIEIITNEIIASVDQKNATLKSGKILPFDAFIWTGGVKGSSVLSKMPLKTEARGRVEVMNEMECLPETPDLKLHSKIYGLGDSICFYDPKTQRPIPGVAPTAISQADTIAHNMIEVIKLKEGLVRESRLHAYKPKNYPYIIPVGGKYAVAKIGPLIISGFIAWLFKGLVELDYLGSIMPLGKAIKLWAKGLRIFIQNDRLG